MSGLKLFSALTSDYPWKEPFEKSLETHCNIPFKVMEFGIDLPFTTVPNNIVQHGEFLLNAHFDLSDKNPIIMFIDGDMVMQRPFTQLEVSQFMMLPDNTVMLGECKFPGQSLADEVENLQPKVSRETLNQLFPGYSSMGSYSTGFVVCNRKTYEKMFLMCRSLMHIATQAFGHYALVQWLMCYVIQRWLKHRDLPNTIHIHGCWGVKPGMTADNNGTVYWNGTPAAFRHAINLTPEKCLTLKP